MKTTLKKPRNFTFRGQIVNVCQKDFSRILPSAPRKEAFQESCRPFFFSSAKTIITSGKEKY